MTESPGSTPAEALRALLDERRRETEAALGIVARITSTLDVRAVLSESIALAAAVTHAQSGLLYVLGDDQRLRVRAALPADEHWVDTSSLELGGLPGSSKLGVEPALLRERPQEDPRYLPHPDAARVFTSALIHPLTSPSEQLVGAIALFTEREPFAEEDLVAVAPIASLAAAAVETAGLYTSSQRHIDVLRSLGGLGDSLVSPGATRRALYDLGNATRRLLGTGVVAIYVREQHGWRLTMSLTDHDRPPLGEIPFDALDTLASASEPRRISLPADAALVRALVADPAEASGGILAPLRASGETIGALIGIGERHTVSESDRELVSVIATVAAMMIQSGRLVERLASRSPELSFLEALSEGSEPSGVVEARARQLGIALDELHVAAAFQVRDRGTGQADPEGALERLGTELGGRFPNSVAARHGLELLALLRVPGNGSTADAVNAAVKLIEDHDRIKLVGGVSGATGRRGDHPRAFSEARDALSIGKVVGSPQHVLDYDALGAQRHLWALARSPVRDPFQNRVEHLLAYDVEHGTQFLETVEAYLAEQGSRERAAARLGIHRNTLRQRAERIRKVSGIDLEDRENRFELQVAVGIVRFRELQRRR